MPRPVAEQAPSDLDDVLAAQVAADHQRRARRVEDPLVRPPRHRLVEALDRFPGPAGRPVIRRGRRVDRADVRLVGPAARVGLRLQQVVQPLVPQSIDLVGREGRAEQDLGEELEGGRQPRRRHVDTDARGVPAGLGVERRTEPLGGLRQPDGVIPFRALGQGTGGQDGRPGVRGRLVGCPDRHDHRGADQRATRQVGDHHGQAVVELRAGDDRERIGPRRAGLRALGDHHVPLGRLGGHAATSSSTVSRASASSSIAVSSAVGVSGRYVSTSRLSARNVAAATSWIASGVTSR